MENQTIDNKFFNEEYLDDNQKVSPTKSSPDKKFPLDKNYNKRQILQSSHGTDLIAGYLHSIFGPNIEGGSKGIVVKMEICWLPSADTSDLRF